MLVYDNLEPRQTWTLAARRRERTESPIDLAVGPIESVFGAHMIRLIEHTEASVPPIEEIDNQVRGRILRELRDVNFNERYTELRERYEIKVVKTK